MADLTAQGNVRARCPSCKGALTTFEWHSMGTAYGAVEGAEPKLNTNLGYTERYEWRLMRCAGCGRGALAALVMESSKPYGRASNALLLSFFPESIEALPLPPDVPAGIEKEFREAEACLSAKCWRAAAGMFRSVLDKTLRANGYKVKTGTTLEQQIDMAAADGVITAARQKRAHEDIRVLGNDVLHDDWHAITAEDVTPAHQYAQRILEDFYDDRATTVALLRARGRNLVEEASPQTVDAGETSKSQPISKAPKPIKPLGG